MNRFSLYSKGLVAVAVVALSTSPLFATNVVGTVKSVTADKNQLVLTDQNGKDWTFQVGQNAQIQAATNNQAKLADLRAGQTVNITYDLQNNQMVASAIRSQGQQAAQQAQQGQQPAQQAQQGQQTARQADQKDAAAQQGKETQHQARGKIENVKADQQWFTVKDEKGHEWTFHAGRNARIEANGKETKLADLQQGQDVTVSYRQVLTEIQAGKTNETTDNQQAKSQMVRGKIQSVEAGQMQIRLRDQDGKDHTFQIGQNARVQLDGRNATVADLQQGQEVTATRQMVANEIRTGNQNPNPTPNQNR